MGSGQFPSKIPSVNFSVIGFFGTSWKSSLSLRSRWQRIAPGATGGSVRHSHSLRSRWQSGNQRASGLRDTLFQRDLPNIQLIEKIALPTLTPNPEWGSPSSAACCAGWEVAAFDSPGCTGGYCLPPASQAESSKFRKNLSRKNLQKAKI